MSVVFLDYLFFFFKQKTAYEMRISDWSSDVCSSDLAEHAVGRGNGRAALLGLLEQATDRAADQAPDGRAARDRDEASDRAADRRARLALLYAEGLRKGRCHHAGARALQRRYRKSDV